MRQSKWFPYIVCLSAALFFAYELMQLHMMNAISVFLIKDLQMNATSFSNLCSTYLLADVLFLLPAGIILDRFSTRRVILTALLLCLLGTIGFAFATSFLTAAVCHFFSGIGNAFSLLSCIVLVSRWFPSSKQAFVIGLVVTIGMFGGVIAQSPFSLLAEALTWRKALLVDAAFGFLIYGLIYLFVHDSPTAIIPKKNTESLASFVSGIKKSVINRQNINCGLYTAFMNLPLMILGAVFGNLFLTQVHQMELSNASFITSMICMGTILGSPLYGYLSDRSGTRKSWMYLGGFLSLLTMGLIIYLPALPYLSLLSLFFLLGLFSSSQILSYPIITESNPTALTGTSMGVAALIIMGIPMFVGPLVGTLLDTTWTGGLINEARLYAKESYIIAFLPFLAGFGIALLSTVLIYKPKPILDI